MKSAIAIVILIVCASTVEAGESAIATKSIGIEVINSGDAGSCVQYWCTEGSYAIVWMSIENKTKKAKTVNSDDFAFEGEQGHRYFVDGRATQVYVNAYPEDGSALNRVRLLPGEKKDVVAVFEVFVGEYDMIDGWLVFQEKKTETKLNFYDE